jgi:uncharacterized glyoxalase superfamily protein PhnB
MIHQSIPVVRVSSSAEAEEFFRKLGFRREFAMRPDPARIDPAYLGFIQDGAIVHVSSFSGDGALGTVVVLQVDNVDGLYEELQDLGLDFGMAPVDQSWGNREFYVKDADQNSIRFTQPIRSS